MNVLLPPDAHIKLDHIRFQRYYWEKVEKIKWTFFTGSTIWNKLNNGLKKCYSKVYRQKYVGFYRLCLNATILLTHTYKVLVSKHLIDYALVLIAAFITTIIIKTVIFIITIVTITIIIFGISIIAIISKFSLSR